MAAVLPIPPELHAVDQAKLVIMQSLAVFIDNKYPTISRAAIELDLTESRLCHLRAGNYDRFSLPWLITLGVKLGARITITVD